MTFLTLNISEMTRDRVIVTTEHQYEVICALSNGDTPMTLTAELLVCKRLSDFTSTVCLKKRLL